MIPRHAALAGLSLGLVIAVTANIAYALPRGPVVLGVGIVAPLVLPVVLYLRTLFDVDGWRQWVPRELATLAVAGPAVAVSYWHTYALVLGAGEPWLLAVLAPLSSDGLAGMATLALHRIRSTAAISRSATVKVTPKPRPEKRPAPAVADVVEEPDSPGPRLSVAGKEPVPHAARAKELIDAGVPRASAYRQAKREKATGVA